MIVTCLQAVKQSHTRSPHLIPTLPPPQCHIPHDYKTKPKFGYLSWVFSGTLKRPWLVRASARLLHSAACARLIPLTSLSTLHNAGFNRFPFNNFTRCLTPFSRCFSSFPHGTCSLSVSCLYLALDEVYHPFWAAFPNNSTLRVCLMWPLCIAQTGFSPSVMVHSRTLVQCAVFDDTSSDYNSGLRQILNLSYSHFTRRYYGNPC